MRAPPYWQALGIEPTANVAAVRAAYAAKLKITNPEDDAEGFKRLRAAYEAALWDARRRASRAPPPPSAEEDADPEFPDEEFDEEEDGVEEDVRAPVRVNRPMHAPRPRGPYIPRASPNLEIDAHRAACAALETALFANAPPEEIARAYAGVRRSPAMGAIDVYANTEWWLLNLLHRARPASDTLVDQAIADFGWERAAKRIRDGAAAAGALQLRDRIARERAAAATVARFADRRHEFNQPYREITRPFAGRSWLSRQKALLRAGLMQRFLDYVAARYPAAEEGFDQDALAWWRERLSKAKQPYWFWHVLVRGVVIVGIICAMVVFEPPLPSENPSQRSAQFAPGDERVEARNSCSSAIVGRLSVPDGSECAGILSLAPESLLMQQYAGIGALRMRDAQTASERFNNVLGRSPADAYALYGEGYALLSMASSDHTQGALMVAQAIAAEPDVGSYYARLGVPALLTALPVDAQPRVVETRAAPPFDTRPRVLSSNPQAAIQEAMAHFGMTGSLPDGQVRLACLARATGVVSDCVIVDETPRNFGLGEVALRFAVSLRVTPASLNGQPVDRVPIRIPITFRS